MTKQQNIKTGLRFLCFCVFVFGFWSLLFGFAKSSPSGSVLSFDGNDYLTVSDAGVLDQANSLSWSVWVKPASTPGADAYIFYRETAYYLKQTTANTIVGAVYYSSSWHTATTSALSTGQWTHIELTYDTTSGYLKIYKNGVEADSQSHSTAITAVATAMYIGAKNTTPDNPFTGKIDDLRFYQYARTPAQVRQDYNQGMAFYAGPNPSAGSGQATCAEDPGSCLSYGLVGYWSFEEGKGQTTADLSGNSNTGTLGANSSPGTDDPKWTTSGSLPRTAIAGGGGALSFDGSNDYVTLVNSSSLKPPLPITVTGWIKSNNTAVWGGIIMNDSFSLDDDYGNQYGFVLNQKSTGALEVRYGSGNSDSFGRAVKTSSVSLIQGQWQHVVAVIRGQYDMSLYINGVDAGGTYSGSIDGPLKYSGASGRMGEFWNSYHFPGLIDEVRIYNRALSAEEIRYLYNRGGSSQPLGF